MSWIGKIFRRGKGGEEAKAVDFSPQLWNAINGGFGLPTKSKQSVSLSSSLQVTAYYRGVLVIADGIAQLPVEIYRKSGSGRGVEPATSHPLYDLLMHRPNGWQDATGFWRTVLMHAVGAGESVCLRVVVNGEVRELLPIRPEHVTIDLDALMRPTYDLTLEKGGLVQATRDDVFHLQGPSWRGFKALDPAVVGREAIGLAQATEEAHSRLHANGTRPSGILTTKDRMQQADVDRLSKLWAETFGGTANLGKTPILANGLSWEQTSMTGVDAEHLDTRKHQIEEIARLLGVFPIMLGHAGDQSPTFASADAFLEAHVRYTLQPWIKAVKSAIETQLLTADERRDGYHVRIDSSELLRGSLKDRTEYYKAALGTNSSPGWLSVNEIREDDGWSNILEGEEFDRPAQPKDYVAKPPQPVESAEDLVQSTSEPE